MKLFLKITIFSIFFLGLGILFPTNTHSGENICPDDKTLEQCYNELNNRMKELEKQERETTQSLSQERYNQLTLNERIEYTKRKIAESEIEIKKIEIEIETKNVEIRMMERDLERTQDKIASVQQEAQKLNASISKRLSMSYKYSFMAPLELLIQAQDLDHLLRKMRYLVDARKNDRVLLTEMNNKGVVLDTEERVLGKTKLDLEKARIDVENKKTDLFKERQNLAAQQAEQTRLLALSEQREASYQEQLNKIEAAQNQVTQQISAIIRQMYERGQIALDREVKKGEIIGFQGYTGFTYGSHLHLEVYNSNGARVNPFSVGYFTGGSLGVLVGSGSYHQPLDGGVLTQTFHSIHPAIDLQSQTHGDQTNDKYYGQEIRCLGMVRRAGYYNRRGTGAPIRAITDGHVSKEYTDVCGGKYVILKHNNSGSSLYLHLQ